MSTAVTFALKRFAQRAPRSVELAAARVREEAREVGGLTLEVFAQTPPAGQRVEPGTEVQLTVSSGTADTVPNVIGETQESATSILQDLGYSVVATQTTSPQDAGTVIGQIPASGSALQPGQPVNITES